MSAAAEAENIWQRLRKRISKATKSHEIAPKGTATLGRHHKISSGRYTNRSAYTPQPYGQRQYRYYRTYGREVLSENDQTDGEYDDEDACSCPNTPLKGNVCEAEFTFPPCQLRQFYHTSTKQDIAAMKGRQAGPPPKPARSHPTQVAIQDPSPKQRQQQLQHQQPMYKHDYNAGALKAAKEGNRNFHGYHQNKKGPGGEIVSDPDMTDGYHEFIKDSKDIHSNDFSRKYIGFVTPKTYPHVPNGTREPKCPHGVPLPVTQNNVHSNNSMINGLGSQKQQPISDHSKKGDTLQTQQPPSGKRVDTATRPTNVVTDTESQKAPRVNEVTHSKAAPQLVALSKAKVDYICTKNHNKTINAQVSKAPTDNNKATPLASFSATPATTTTFASPSSLPSAAATETAGPAGAAGIRVVKEQQEGGKSDRAACVGTSPSNTQQQKPQQVRSKIPPKTKPKPVRGATADKNSKDSSKSDKASNGAAALKPEDKNEMSLEIKSHPSSNDEDPGYASVEEIPLDSPGNSSNSASPEVQVGNQRMLVPPGSGPVTPPTGQTTPAPPSGQGARPKLRPLSQSNRRRYNPDQNGNVNNGSTTPGSAGSKDSDRIRLESITSDRSENSVTDLSEAMSMSTSPDSSREEDEFPPPPAELLNPDGSGFSFSRPEYREALERPLINLDGTPVDVGAMYATPAHKSAPRTPEAEFSTNEMFVNRSDGLDRNRNVNGGTLSPTENGNGNSSDKEYQELPPPPLPTRRYKNGNGNGNKNGKSNNTSGPNLLGIDDQQKKELMKNYDDVPLRKPLPAPGPVPDVVEETTKTTPPAAPMPKPVGNKTQMCNGPVTKDGKKDVDEDSVDGCIISPTSPRSVEFPKPVVKGKPVNIPVVPELKRIEPKREEKVKNVPAEKKEEVRKVVENNGPKMNSSSPPKNNASGSNDVPAKDELVLRKTLLQEIKNFSKDIEIKLQNKNKQKEEKVKKEEYEQKKKLEELRQKDLQDYPYEDVDVQTEPDGKKHIKPRKDGGGKSGGRRNEEENERGEKGKKKSAYHHTFPRKKFGAPGDMMSQSMFAEPTQTSTHYDVTTNEPIHMTLEEVRAEAQNRQHMRSLSQSYQQRSPPHHENGPSAVNALYGYDTSPRKLRTQTSKNGEKTKKSSPFKDRFKLPNFSKLLDKAFGDDGRKEYQQYSHSSMSANTPKRNLARRSMSHSAAHSYSSSSQPHTHFATSKRFSASGVSAGGPGHKDRGGLPDVPPSGTGSGGGPQRWSVCQCEPYVGGQEETRSPKTRRPAPAPPCPKPTPSPRYSIHRYPLGMHNSHDDIPDGEITGNANADFINSLRKLKDCGWYWGPLSWDDAESRLANKPDGSFLVRDSSDDRYILSLSFRSQGTTHHTRIEHYKGTFSFYSQPKSHGAGTILEFIEKAMEHSRNGKFLYFLRPKAPGLPPAPVQLLFPVSRFRILQSLQHACRFVILKHVRYDHIDPLPLPPKMKAYLRESQYYAEYIIDNDNMRGANQH